MSDPGIPNALTVAGIDPSGGAGIYADLKAFSALGAYGCGVVAALTAQNTQAVAGIHGVPPDFVRLQLDTLFADVRIDTAKIGMLGTAPIARAVAEGLARPVAAGAPAHVVVDPVMVAKSGDSLLTQDATAMLVEAILPLATLITPNLPEAGVLLQSNPAWTLTEMRARIDDLRQLGSEWVLLKGGHLEGSPESVDILCGPAGKLEFAAPRIATTNDHGTGCTLSAAIAALLPSRSVEDSVREAKAFMHGALAASHALDVGHGHGPLHHFHRLWVEKRPVS